MSIGITTLSKKDLDQYMDLVQAGFGAELRKRGTNISGIGRMAALMLSCNSLPLRLIELLTGRGLFALVAKDGPRVVGILTVLKKKVPILIGAYVLEDYRRSGVALGLVQEALVRLEGQGYAEVQGAVFDHRAQLLVERAGFAPYDHIDLYQRSLPTGILAPAGAAVQRAHRGGLPRNSYDLGMLNIFTGVRVRNMVVHSGGEETIAGTLIALPHQTVAEVQPRCLTLGREDTFYALLSFADEWFSNLGRSMISVSLQDDTASLADLLTKAGFVKRHSWVKMRIEL